MAVLLSGFKPVNNHFQCVLIKGPHQLKGKDPEGYHHLLTWEHNLPRKCTERADFHSSSLFFLRKHTYLQILFKLDWIRHFMSRCRHSYSLFNHYLIIHSSDSDGKLFMLGWEWRGWWTSGGGRDNTCQLPWTSLSVIILILPYLRKVMPFCSGFSVSWK